MTIQHSLLTGSNLHEPKGVSGAAAGEVYVADGAGSGAWDNLVAANLDFSALTNGDYVTITAGVPSAVTLNNANLVALTVYLADASTASDAWVVSPLAGTITTIWTVAYDACDADTVITPSIGGVAVTSGAITIAAAGAAAGDVDSSTPSAANDVTAGQAIRFLSDGGATTALPLSITVLIDVGD